VLLFELFPAFVTVVATAVAVVLFIVARRRRGHAERRPELRDPTRPDAGTATRFTRPSMRG
jgi:hypothetical protein